MDQEAKSLGDLLHCIKNLGNERMIPVTIKVAGKKIPKGIRDSDPLPKVEITELEDNDEKHFWQKSHIGPQLLQF